MIGGAALILLICAFIWLVVGAAPENVPQDIKIIEIPDTGDT